MLALFKILLTLMLMGNNTQQTIISNYLKSQLHDYDKIEHTILSPKDIEQYSIIIDSSREFQINGNYGYVPVKQKRTSMAVLEIL